MRALAAISAVLLAVAPAAATENLVAGLSQDTVEITSNYTGTDIVVFGAIEQAEAGGNDVVVVLRGPDADMIVRKKDSVAGIWINRDQARLYGMPSYYYIASSKPLARIADHDALQRYAIGLSNLAPERISSHHDPKPFIAALVRHEQQAGLYGESATGVEFLSPTLFRAHVPVPASVPRGQYNAEVYLFRGGTIMSAQSTPLFIDQTGLERRLYEAAHASPLLYGLSTVLMGILMGWLSSIVFRRNA